MRTLRRMAVAVATMLVLGSVVAHAASTATYQVTGPVLAVTDDAITVQKGKDKWEIARDAATKVNGDLKVGAKVTIQYRMTAASVEVKGEGGAGKKSKAK